MSEGLLGSAALCWGLSCSPSTSDLCVTSLGSTPFLLGRVWSPCLQPGSSRSPTNPAAPGRSAPKTQGGKEWPGSQPRRESLREHGCSQRTLRGPFSQPRGWPCPSQSPLGRRGGQAVHGAQNTGAPQTIAAHSLGGTQPCPRPEQERDDPGRSPARSGFPDSTGRSLLPGLRPLRTEGGPARRWSPRAGTGAARLGPTAPPGRWGEERGTRCPLPPRPPEGARGARGPGFTAGPARAPSPGVYTCRLGAETELPFARRAPGREGP